ncbi:MAG: hypothetical protein JWQ18_2818 [Conexibacter sp.]|nr:hypothetical protein [Conexibacter sp.]
MNEFRTLVLLSLQRALLGMVTPDLRSVEVALDEGRVHATFTYDGVVTDDHRELVSEVEGMVIGDLDDDVEVQFEAERRTPPDPVGVVRGTTYCYLRRET